MGDLNDHRYFATVVDSGGFSAAARVLGLPKSRLSRRVAALEAQLGVRLLQRSTRRLTLTDVGQQVLGHSRALLREAEAAALAAAQRVAEPSGRVRVSLPSGVLDGPLGAVFTQYLADHPRVQLELLLTGRRVDLIEEGIDLALRVRSPDDEDPQWATRRLLASRALLVAAPSLLAALPPLATPEDLKTVPALGAAGPDLRVHWRLQGPDGALRAVSAPARLVCEHFGLRQAAALAGLGVTLLPEALVAPALAAGQLVPVLPAWQLPTGHLQAVYASQRGLSPAVRVLLDRLANAVVDGGLT
ncbi:MAG: LysR family transcriptional regulator [Rubrivivax sp.]|nr:LysR family transcriptional regulator [Rubrivivax sp.]